MFVETLENKIKGDILTKICDSSSGAVTCNNSANQRKAQSHASVSWISCLYQMDVYNTTGESLFVNEINRK